MSTAGQSCTPATHILLIIDGYLHSLIALSSAIIGSLPSGYCFSAQLLDLNFTKLHVLYSDLSSDSKIHVVSVSDVE
jgi:hypothetical protein